MSLVQGRTIAGKYLLERPLGQGGMGEVWVVRHVHLGRLFALKVMKKSAIESPDSRGRFEREARVAASLVSPYIAQVTDSGIDGNDVPYMVMELLEGEDLHRRIKREGKLPVATVVRIAAQVGKALRVAHAADLVHRDLKPANIFLAQQDDEEIAKVLDFGIAKVISDVATDYTQTGELLGTAVFMSPEQLQNAKAVDGRADLWSFGVTLFRALTGEYPFPGPSYRYVLAAQKGDVPAPQRATAVVAELPPAVDVFFERAFAKDLAGRYPTAQAMVEGFCRALGLAPAAGDGLAATPTAPAQLGMRLAYAPDQARPASGPPPATPAQPASVPPPAAPLWPASTPPPAGERKVRPLARTLPLGAVESGSAPSAPGLEEPSEAAATVPRPRQAVMGAQTAFMAPGEGLPNPSQEHPLIAPIPQLQPGPARGSIGIPAAPHHSSALTASARARRSQVQSLAIAIFALVAVLLVVVLLVRCSSA